ncbi:MAG: ATP-binding protein [Opitutaceae bacterium]
MEANATLQAIRRGEVDAVVAGQKDGQVFTVRGAERAYRVLIESMNEGALTLTTDRVILFANTGFARLVKFPLQRVIGSSLERFLTLGDQARLRPLIKEAGPAGSKLQVTLNGDEGVLIPVQISLRRLARSGADSATLGLVVTDMTETRRHEDRLRALTNRVVQAHEAERGRVAFELHEHITQVLCAIVFRSQAMVGKLSAHNAAVKTEATLLSAMLVSAAHEAERISRNLRPSVLDQLGLVAGIRETTREFTRRTSVPVKLFCAALTPRLPAEVDLALYRILQEALKNVERHAQAGQVTVSLSQQGDCVRLAVDDDGVGFNAGLGRPSFDGNHRLGLLGMHERANHANGTLTVRSARRAGTEIEVRIPLGPVDFTTA